MTDVHEIRRKNLIELISMYKSVANLNSALVDFSHYFRWLFANFRDCSLSS